jgi:hypothetical protein
MATVMLNEVKHLNAESLSEWSCAQHDIAIRFHLI